MPRVLHVPCSACGLRFGGDETFRRHRVLAGDRYRCLRPGELVTKNYYFRDGAWHRGASLLPPTTASLFDVEPESGQGLADKGMALANGAASPEWKRKWDAAIRDLARAGEPFTADDVRDRAGEPTDHPNACGARFNAAARSGLIERVGYRKSARPILHSHPIALWQGRVSA